MQQVIIGTSNVNSQKGCPGHARWYILSP